MNELGDPHNSILRDFTPQELTPLIYKMLGLLEAPWDYLIVAAMDPDTCIHAQCADTVRLASASWTRSTWVSGWMRRLC